jgi:hypothetical protein
MSRRATCDKLQLALLHMLAASNAANVWTPPLTMLSAIGRYGIKVLVGIPEACEWGKLIVRRGSWPPTKEHTPR